MLLGLTTLANFKIKASNPHKPTSKPHKPKLAQEPPGTIIKYKNNYMRDGKNGTHITPSWMRIIYGPNIFRALHTHSLS